jgi:hypothetical protein
VASDRTFELGLVMAGAISAGAYTAGVIDFFFEALDAYEAAKIAPGWNGPVHDVRVPIMSGASAGGMTSAISALHAFHELAHVLPAKPPPAPEQNRLYSSWVSDISLEALLETSDLENGREASGVKSLLCCDVLEKIVARAFDMTPGVRDRAWIGRGPDHTLRVMLTLTNLRGAPYSFRLFGSRSAETYGMLNHGDYFDFTVGVRPAAAGDSCSLDIGNLQQPEWDLFRTTALATGAFPVGLAPRVVTRADTAFYRDGGTVGYEDSQHKFVAIPPDHVFDRIAPYTFVSVDGGVIDNAPLELARRYLAGGATLDADGAKADQAVLLIAPFPNLAQIPPDDANDTLIHVLERLLSALIDQARFKPEELQKAADDSDFSRFMISPTRESNGTPEAKAFPIACGVLNGFGGFLHESFRRHDYLLGRRNAQAFLRWNFGLPDSNALFRGVPIDQDRWHVRDPEGRTETLPAEADRTLKKQRFAETVGGPEATFGFPIIPLVDDLLKPIEIPPEDMPKPENVDLDGLSDKIRTRAKKVISTLVDVDLQKIIRSVGLDAGIAGRIAAFSQREGADWIAAPVLAEVLTKKAVATIKTALDEVREAFA